MMGQHFSNTDLRLSDGFVRNSVIRDYKDSNLVQDVIQVGRRTYPCLITIG
jgi:hypothetical protein